MRVNTDRSRAKKYMRLFGQKKNRPEQILAGALLQTHLPNWAIVEVEDMVTCFNPDEPGVPKEVSVDITVRLPRKKVVIELNGPPHDELPQKRRDNRKQILLEWEGNDWKFLKFGYNKMEILFTRNRRFLNYNETVRAYGEILVAVDGLLPLQEANKIKIEEVLRKTQLS